MSELITIEKPDMTALSTELDPLIAQANELVVDSIESHGAALEGYKYIKRAIKKIKEHFEPSRKALDTAKKEILLARDKMIAPFEAAMGIASGKVDAYEQEQRRIAKERADREAEEERKRQEEQAIADAEAAEKAGDDKLASEIIERPIEVTTPAPVVSDTVAKVKGVSSRTIYKAEVTDFAALLKFAASSEAYSSFVEPNMTKLNELARFHKESLRIPGVRAVSETVRSVR